MTKACELNSDGGEKLDCEERGWVVVARGTEVEAQQQRESKRGGRCRGGGKLGERGDSEERAERRVWRL